LHDQEVHYLHSLSLRGASRTGRRGLTECSTRGRGKRSCSGRNY